MSFGAFVNGLMGGYQAGQNLQDQAQKRKLRQFEVEKEEEAAALRKQAKDVDQEAKNAVEMARQGLAGDGMGPSEHLAPAPADAGPVTSEPITPAAMAQEGVAPPPPAVGLPAGQVGPGEMRPSAIEAAGATQANPPAAAAGTATQTMPLTTVKPPKDVKKTESFHEARMRIAQERGNSELLGKYTKEYATHLVDQSTIAAKQFEAKQRPILEEMAKIKTEAEWKALPEETRAKMLKAQADVAEQSARAGASGWQMVQNPMTRKEGLTLLGHAFGEDQPLKDIQREGDYFLPIGADGKQIVGQDGKPVRVHKDAAERMVAQYGSKAPGIVMKDGDQLRNPNTGALIAENKKDPRQEPDQKLRRQDQVNSRLMQDYGVKDSMGNLMVSPEKKAEYQAVRSLAERYAADGMDASEAIDKAVADFNKKGKPAAPGAAPAAAAKPVDTSKYKF